MKYSKSSSPPVHLLVSWASRRPDEYIQGKKRDEKNRVGKEEEKMERRKGRRGKKGEG